MKFASKLAFQTQTIGFKAWNMTISVKLTANPAKNKIHYNFNGEFTIIFSSRATPKNHHNCENSPFLEALSVSQAKNDVFMFPVSAVKQSKSE